MCDTSSSLRLFRRAHSLRIRFARSRAFAPPSALSPCALATHPLRSFAGFRRPSAPFAVRTRYASASLVRGLSPYTRKPDSVSPCKHGKRFLFPGARLNAIRTLYHIVGENGLVRKKKLIKFSCAFLHFFV